MIGKKILIFLYGLTPTLAWLAVQVILSVGYGISWLFLQGPAEMFPAAAKLLELLDSQGVYLLSILVNVIFFAFGIFWYRAVLKKEERDTARRLSPAGWGYGLCVGLAVQTVSIYFLMAAAFAAPSAMEEYGQLMDSMGIGAPTLLSLLYGTVAAPVVEELIYRGLTLKIFQKAFPFWAWTEIRNIERLYSLPFCYQSFRQSDWLSAAAAIDPLPPFCGFCGRPSPPPQKNTF